MIQDVQALFSEKQGLAPASDGTSESFLSTNYIDRSDGILSGESAGDLGNGRPIIVTLQVGAVARAASGTAIPVTERLDVYMISSNHIHSTNVGYHTGSATAAWDVVDDTKQHTVTIEGQKIRNQALLASIQLIESTKPLPQFQLKIPARKLFGRYIQLVYRANGGNADILASGGGVTAFIGRNTGDAQFYYKDRSSI